ncbi:MAG: hypothetical protein ACHQF3_01340, partial [Alphaproteobacteria bacterium]
MATALIGGRLIDGNGREPVEKAGLVIADGVIRAAGPMAGLRLPKDALRIDLDGRTVMPGLIDCHTHLTYHASQPDVWQLDFKESVELNT